MRKYNFIICTFIIILNWSCRKSLQSKPPDENMVFVEGGTFLMGYDGPGATTNEQPVHEVTLNDFYIDKYEVTNKQYCEFLNSYSDSTEATLILLEFVSCIKKLGNRYFTMDSCANKPANFIFWSQANIYAKWAGKRLPTEAEWEYAARGGQLSQGFNYSGSNDLADVAWHSNVEEPTTQNKFKGTVYRILPKVFETHPVGLKKPNELGLYDMNGNVSEWCEDWFDPKYYYNSPKQNPQGPDSALTKVVRGGSYNSYLTETNCTFRSTRSNLSFFDTGFRCVWDESVE
ncbi:MAG: formylglycine-generating enzyme family protein [Saprospiraceae bacterium]